MIKKVHKNITILGRVQGVGFRYAARKIAISVGINGFVKNLPNGTVYIEAEGSEVQLKHLIDWCYTGPPYANVDDIKITDAEIADFNSFDILH